MKTKTTFMVFGGVPTDCEIKLNLNGTEIEGVYETKFLGVIIDHKLCWKPHIQYIKGKLAKSVGILYKTRELLNQKCLHILYFSLVVPYMSYCVEVWGNVYKTNIDPIIKLQKRAIRIINKVSYLESTNPLFIKSCTLKCVDIIYIKTLEIVFRAKSKSLPVCIQCLFEPREGKYNLRGLCIFKTRKKARTNVKARCVSILGVIQWNSLGDGIKLCTSQGRFKKALKSQIIQEYSSE